MSGGKEVQESEQTLGSIRPPKMKQSAFQSSKKAHGTINESQILWSLDVLPSMLQNLSPEGSPKARERRVVVVVLLTQLQRECLNPSFNRGNAGCHHGSNTSGRRRNIFLKNVSLFISATV